MWWTLAAAFAGPSTEAPLATVQDQEARARARVRATRMLGRFDHDPSVPGLVNSLAATLDQELPESLGPAIHKTLRRLDARGVWMTQIGDPSPAIRAQAAYRLGRTGDAKVAPLLLGALDDSSADVREAAAGALAAYPDAVPHLALRLTDPVVDVRLAAALTLGFIGTDEAYEALTAAQATESDVFVRHHIKAALGHIDRRRNGFR